MTKTVSLLWVCLLSLVCAVGVQAQSVDCNNPTSVAPDGRTLSGSIPALTTFWFSVAARGASSYAAEANYPTAADSAFPTLNAFAPGDVQPGCSGASSLSPRNLMQFDPVIPNGNRVSVTAASAMTILVGVINSSMQARDFTVRVSETTLFNPLWSTFGGFETFYRLQNTGRDALNVTLRLINDAGTTVATHNQMLAANSTAPTIFTGPAPGLGLADDQAGQAIITHDGPPGAVQVDGFVGRFDLATPVVLPIKIVAAREGVSVSRLQPTGGSGGGGGVNSVTAGDASITIGGTATDPTVQVSDAGITTAKLAANSVATANLQDSSVTADKLAEGSYWRLGGNTGTTPGTNFLGTSDNAALDLRVNNARALRLEPNPTSPNLIGGFSGNSVAGGVLGATIGGGGEAAMLCGTLSNQPCANHVSGDFGTVGGGRANTASGLLATVGGGRDNTASSGRATVGGGQGNTASGLRATVGGGVENTASGVNATVGGGFLNTASEEVATVGGGWGNSATAVKATIAGGGRTDNANAATGNRVTDDFGTVGGGGNNQAGNAAGTTGDAPFATVGGGASNAASGARATVGGGANNTASASQATVGGGGNNTASASEATVGGGFGNTASGPSATVGGGGNNMASGAAATVGGGEQNAASFERATVSGGIGNTASDEQATVGGGGDNTASGTIATVGGGQGNTASRFGATVGGGFGNTAAAVKATIAGGGRTDDANPATGNRVTDNFGTIGGGGNNQSGDNAGTSNDDHNFATVGGGNGNTASGPSATVGGGGNNVASGAAATVGGGGGNVASGNSSTVAGGFTNTASAADATVGGGTGNIASSLRATVGGGVSNIASDNYATVGGGNGNTASGVGATVPGGLANTAQGVLSLAAGRRAKALHDGAFVWGDSTDADMASTAANQFVVRASGRIFFQSDSTLDDQGGFINTSTGGFLSLGGAWTNASDVAVKENFAPADPQAILARLVELPVQSWNYKAEGPAVRRLGPTAQDFYAAFGLGADDKHISGIDAQGVAFAAIQALHRQLQEKDQQLRAQQKRLEALEAQIAELKAALRPQRAARTLD